MSSYSVRRRLLVGLATGFTIVVAGSGLWLNNAVSDAVTEQFDRELLGRARTLMAVTEQEDGAIQFDYDGKVMPEFERERRPDYFEIRRADGRSLFRSTRLREDLPASGGPDFAMSDRRLMRLLVVRFDPTLEDPPGTKPISLVLSVARGREQLDATLTTVRWSIFGAGAASALLALLLTWRALAAGFRPLARVAASVESLDAEALDARISLPRTPRELAPVVDQLNALLERLEQSFDRERRFNANVAHELRTPIAELRSLASVGGQWPEDRASVVQFFEDVQAVAAGMELVITDLLLLARCEAGVEPALRQPTRLAEAVDAAWRRVGDGRKLALALGDDPIVATDPGKLGILLDNLLRNAVAYAAAGSNIRVGGRSDGTSYALAIENQARTPLAADELARVAEPFWRRDEARSSGGHAGLGLSVVVALAELLGLEVRFDQDESGVFRATVAGFRAASS